MAYTLSNKCAKNLCKWTVPLQLIIKNVVTCFFLEHSVYIIIFLLASFSLPFSDMSLVGMALDMVD